MISQTLCSYIITFSSDSRKDKDDDDKKRDFRDAKREDRKPNNSDEDEDDDIDDKKERRLKDKKSKDKLKLFTKDKHLLLSFVYFDQTHCGYILDRDIEELLHTLGMLQNMYEKMKLYYFYCYRFKLIKISSKEASK